jgi:hypothetical protein
METSLPANSNIVSFSKPMQAGAQLVSYLAHPAFIPVLVSAIILFLHPVNVLLLPFELRIRIMAMVFLNTFLFPTLIVFLLWRLGFIKNMYLENQKERIIPLVGSIIFYFWAYYVGRNIEYIPHALQQWLMGVFLCSCAAMFINIFRKISLHTIGIGGFVAFCVWQQATDLHWNSGWLMLGLLLAGLVGTARLIRGAHEPAEVYGGFLAGAICQIAASLIMG